MEMENNAPLSETDAQSTDSLAGVGQITDEFQTCPFEQEILGDEPKDSKEGFKNIIKEESIAEIMSLTETLVIPEEEEEGEEEEEEEKEVYSCTEDKTSTLDSSSSETDQYISTVQDLSDDISFKLVDNAQISGSLVNMEEKCIGSSTSVSYQNKDKG